MTDERWTSPLGTRYASPAMQRLWGEPHRIGLWRRIWLALAEAERELGLPITDEALAQIQNVAVEVAQAAVERLSGLRLPEAEVRAALDRELGEAA